jgi:hypothetical protein
MGMRETAYMWPPVCVEGDDIICYFPKCPFNNCFNVPMQTVDVNNPVNNEFVIMVFEIYCSKRRQIKKIRCWLPRGSHAKRRVANWYANEAGWIIRLCTLDQYSHKHYITKAPPNALAPDSMYYVVQFFLHFKI